MIQQLLQDKNKWYHIFKNKYQIQLQDFEDAFSNALMCLYNKKCNHGYIYRTIESRILDFLRKESKFEELQDYHLVCYNNAPRKILVEELLSTISPTERTVVLYWMGGYTTTIIGDMMNLNRLKVWRIKERAFSKMRNIGEKDE